MQTGASLNVYDLRDASQMKACQPCRHYPVNGAPQTALWCHLDDTIVIGELIFVGHNFYPIKYRAPMHIF